MKRISSINSLLEKLQDDFLDFNPKIVLNSYKIRKTNNTTIENTDKICNLIKQDFGLTNLEKIKYINYSDLLDSKFISKQVKKCINKEIKYNLKIIFLVNEIKINLDCYFINESDLVKFIKKLKLIVKIYSFMTFYFKTNKNLKLILYCTDLEKKLDFRKNNILDENNVNSGLSSFSKLSDKDNYIMIWRKEEFFKVFIHEIIHYLNLDFKSELTLKNIFDILCIDKNMKIIPNEAFTDFWAITLNCIIYTSINPKQNLIENIEREIKFILEQSAKIIYYYGFSSWDDFSKNKCSIYFNQKTSIFSYYILKSCMFFYFNRTIQFLINDDDKLILRNIKKNEYEDYLSDIINSNKYIDFMNTLIKNMYSSSKVSNNLRMSNLQINFI
jgi:hypothetical protein